MSTRRPAMDMCPWTMNCRPCRGGGGRPASTWGARTSSSVAPSRGRIPARPSGRMRGSRSRSACTLPVRMSAWRIRARSRKCARRDWDRHSSFLFLRPYFLRISFSALMRSPSHGWEGRSYFFRGNFGSPKPSLLLRLRLLSLFLLGLFLLRPAALLLGLGRGDRRHGGLLRHSDRESRAAVGSGPLPADFLALLVPDPPVGPDHLHAVDIVAGGGVHVGPRGG